MKILLIPELDWMAALQNRVHKIFKRLARDHEIHVIYFEHERKGINKSYKLKKGIILHKPPMIYVKNMLLFYLLNAFSIYSYIKKLIRTHNIQIIVTTNFLFAPFVIRAANSSKIPVVFDVVDFQSFHINYIKNIPGYLKKMGNIFLTSLLNFDILNAHYLITTGLPLYRYIKQKNLKNVTIIPNGVDTTLFNTNYNGIAVRKQFRINSPIICFIGALEYWIDYQLFFHTIALLQEKYPDLHCLCIGPSRHFGLKRIKQLAYEYGVLNRITFTGRIPYHQLPAYICASDVCVLPFVKNYLTHCIIPMKLFEYLACERPVVSTSLAGVKSIAKNSIFYADTPTEFCDRICYVLNNKEKLQGKIHSGKILVKKHSWDDLSEKYGQILERIYSCFSK